MTRLGKPGTARERDNTPTARLRLGRVGLGLVVVLVGVAGCTRQTASPSHIGDPPRSVPPKPDYAQACAPSGPDFSLPCTQVVLQAIDNARAKEHVGPMLLPVDFPQLTVPEQLFVVLNRERVDRGLAPFEGLTAALDGVAAVGAAAGRLPPDPGKVYVNLDTEWIGDVDNTLDADYEWMYDDGPGSAPGCSKPGQARCWDDRHIILDDFGSGGSPVLGAAYDPAGDKTAGDVGGTSLAAVMAAAASPGTMVYTWAQALADSGAGTIQPADALPADASSTHIPDPPSSEPASPDYTRVCAPEGLDSSPACIAGVLQAVNHARAAEEVKPMVLPAGFGALGIPQQIFVAVNLERVDRGLPPFVGLTAVLNRNAQKGADSANDPPDPGKSYAVADTEWAGGSSNGLDAVYGWMYDDGIGSGNLDCPKHGGPGCWGHRHGLLDNFGTVGTMVMGAALNPTADTGADKGGTSMAATLATTSQAIPPGSFVYLWAQVVPPAGATPAPAALSAQ
jgi:hypothetical protein